jgi:hypothetical protein
VQVSNPAISNIAMKVKHAKATLLTEVGGANTTEVASGISWWDENKMLEIP